MRASLISLGVSVKYWKLSSIARNCLLVAKRPSNIQVFLRDGSAQTILRAATLR